MVLPELQASVHWSESGLLAASGKLKVLMAIAMLLSRLPLSDPKLQFSSIGTVLPFCVSVVLIEVRLSVVSAENSV